MNHDSRTKNSSRNIIFSMIAYIVQIVLGFVVRRYFIYFFCEEYLGINSVFSNVLSLLSLAELGFGTAIVFAMYKPMATGDKEQVRELLQFYKKCYTIIGLVVLGIGLAVFPFMQYFKNKAPNVDVNFYIVYAIYLFNSVISYFFSYRRSLLYTSQRSDIESKVNLALNILASALQILVLFTLQNFYVYLAILGLSTIVNNIIIYIYTDKHYAEYIQKPISALSPDTRKQINKNILAMIYHKIGGAVVYSTDSLLVYFMLGSSVLGKYSNYLLITTYVTALISIITNAIKGSVGNSIASESTDKNLGLFQKLNFIYMWLVSFCTICIFVLSDPFIDIVLTKDPNANLLFDKTIITLIAFNFYFSVSRYMCGTFKECAGLFYQDRYKPLAEALINLVASIVLTYFFGLAGIIAGTIISSISTGLWVEPYVLYKHYFNSNFLKYMLKHLWFTLATIVSAIGTYFVCNFIPNTSIWLLALKFATCIVVSNVFLLACLCFMPNFKSNVGYLKTLAQSVLKRGKDPAPSAPNTDEVA